MKIIDDKIRSSIRWKIFLIFFLSLLIVILTQALTVYLYYRQGVSSENANLLFLQNQSIESLSRKFLQVTILSNSARNNNFDIFNLNLNIERDIKQINDCAVIMLKGGDILLDGKYQAFPPIDKIYHEKIKNIRLLLNAFMFTKDIILKSNSVAEREKKLVLLTSIIGQLTGKNQSILRGIKKEVNYNQKVFILVMVFAILIVVVAFLFIRKYIVEHIINPLKSFSERFLLLSEGNIGTEIEYIRKDEFGELYHSFNLFIRVLKGITRHFQAILSESDEIHGGKRSEFILNPIHISEIFMRMNKVLRMKDNNRVQLNKITLSDKNNIYFFDPDNVLYFSSSAKNTIIHTLNRDYSLNIQFKALELILPDSFIRVHKQYIVNSKYLSRLTHIKSGHYKILLNDEDDTELPIGRSYLTNLRSKISL